MEQPRLYIVAGCNGAGKTTASYTVLPDILGCRQYVNADEIARGLSPFNPASVLTAAGRIMLGRIWELIESGQTFACETTLATRSYKTIIERAREHGYVVHLLYIWLASPALAVQRVAQRVAEGGHNVPVPTIVRRYRRGLVNLFRMFMPMVNAWTIVDNTAGDCQIVANQNEIIDKERYNQIARYEREGK